MVKSRFEEASEEIDDVAVQEGEEAEAYVPRAVFTGKTPDISKMQIPQLRLAQGLTQEVTERKAQIGQYVLTNFPAVDSLVLIPLAAQHIRKYKPDPRGPALCQAPTGDIGIGKPGGVCEVCPLSQWGPRDPKTGKSRKPACTEAVMIRAYSDVHRTVVDFEFAGRAMSKGQFIQQQAMAFGYAGFALRMGNEQQKNNFGVWVEPTLEMILEVPEQHVEVVNKWYDAIQKMIEGAQTPQLVSGEPAVETPF